MAKDKDEGKPKPKVSRTCPECGKDHRPDGEPSTDTEHIRHHRD